MPPSDRHTDKATDRTGAYEAQALVETEKWRRQMQKRPGLWDATTRATQDRINRVIPEPVHKLVTVTIEKMTRGIMTGSGWISGHPITSGTLEERETAIAERIKFYSRTASVEGGVAGAGGFVLAAADFPALMAIKIKLLFEICAIYGHDSRDPGERLYILRTFQMAFSSARHRPDALKALEDTSLDQGFQDFDWRHFQLEYRDYIDLVKMAQLLPLIGAPVGVIANRHLTRHLARTAIKAYRLRWFAERSPYEP